MNAADEARAPASRQAGSVPLPDPTPSGVPSGRAATVPVAVLGGGPIGMLCSLLLARAGIDCELVDARPLETLQHDRRLLALSRGTLLVLEQALGGPVGDRLALAPIERVHVSSQGKLGAVELGARDFGGRAVGATAWYADLCAALMTAIERLAAGGPGRARIGVRRPCRAIGIAQRHDRVEVELDSGGVLHAMLAVNAEGSPPAPAAPLASALLAPVALAGPRLGDAIERFTPSGPLAFLPMPAVPGAAPAPRADGARLMSMVWCLPTAAADEARRLPEHELIAHIGRALGARIGLASAVGARTVFPLATHLRARVCAHRVVHLGNAAQSLHPVAGQGFNLGVRDCACLVECLVEGQARGRGAPGQRAHGAMAPIDDPLAALAQYRRRRWLDRNMMPRLTGALPRVFGSEIAPIVAARGAAMLLLDGLPLARRAFTRLLMYGG